MIKRLAEVLAQRQDRLPRPEPEVFSGHTLIYPMWKKSFETFIERKTKDSSELLCYLGKYTSGESVSGILSLNSVSTVRESIGSLRYGDYGLRTTAGRALSFVRSTRLSRANIER